MSISWSRIFPTGTEQQPNDCLLYTSGAVLLGEKVAGGMGPGTHGSTFGGNPVVCAGANVVVDRMATSFLTNVNDRAVQLRAGTAKLPHVKSISGRCLWARPRP